jgi:uncharacterized protein YggL (DUF469 family)
MNIWLYYFGLLGQRSVLFMMIIDIVSGYRFLLIHVWLTLSFMFFHSVKNYKQILICFKLVMCLDSYKPKIVNKVVNRQNNSLRNKQIDEQHIYGEYQQIDGQEDFVNEKKAPLIVNSGNFGIITDINLQHDWKTGDCPLLDLMFDIINDLAIDKFKYVVSKVGALYLLLLIYFKMNYNIELFILYVAILLKYFDEVIINGLVVTGICLWFGSRFLCMSNTINLDWSQQLILKELKSSKLLNKVELPENLRKWYDYSEKDQLTFMRKSTRFLGVKDNFILSNTFLRFNLALLHVNDIGHFDLHKDNILVNNENSLIIDLDNILYNKCDSRNDVIQKYLSNRCVEDIECDILEENIKNKVVESQFYFVVAALFVVYLLNLMILLLLL